jgi:hypothetical protein
LVATAATLKVAKMWGNEDAMVRWKAIRNNVSDERQVQSMLDMSEKCLELRAQIKVELVKVGVRRAKNMI